MSDSYLSRLPIGQRVPAPTEGMTGWEIFPFEGDLKVKVLEPPVLPEPPRHGEDADSCNCKDGFPHAIWSDDDWVLVSPAEPAALPAIVLVKPRGHYDSDDLPAPLAAALYPLLQRVERAIMGLGGIARVHHYKWGDGSAHLHYWLMARPAGMMQLRGSCMPLWDDLLPRVPADEWRATQGKIAQTLAVDGGTAHV